MNAQEAKAYLNGSTAYSTPTRRSRGPLIICGIAAFIFFTIFFSTSSVQQVSTIAKDAAHNLPAPHIPSLHELHDTFKSSSAHKPPIQSNSSSGSTKWYSDWKWMNPFSSSVTLDETRIVLPPLKERPVIYTYYEPISKDEDVLAEEKKVLTIWRKAWWAQGFKPIILGSKEAIQNPLYETLQTRKVDAAFKKELMRWLAWGWMGPGVMTNWLLLPMAPWHDADLAYLGRGAYGTNLVRYETMGNSIYAAPSKDEINKAIKTAIDNPKLDKQTILQEAVPDTHFFTVQVEPTGLAYYNAETLKKQYPSIMAELKDKEVNGWKSLQLLMTAHLHGIFLEQFKEGIAIHVPDRKHTTILASQSVQLATMLNRCTNSPLPQSCPPNKPTCRPCKAVKISYTTEITNATDIFTIGMVPHPYTMALLDVEGQHIDVPWVRRHAERDPWVTGVTGNLDKGLSAYTRIITFKNLIAHDETRHASIWHSVERDWAWKDWEWQFGFALASPELEAGAKADVVSHPEVLSTLEPTDAADPPELKDLLHSLGTHRPTHAALKDQAGLVKKAKEVLMDEKYKGPTDMRKVIEAWNLADTEAWRFVSALNARQRVQRAKWEEEEAKFVGGEGAQ